MIEEESKTNPAAVGQVFDINELIISQSNNRNRNSKTSKNNDKIVLKKELV